MDKRTEIYIPVWIDQKHLRMMTNTYTEKNLHSSMDRLETIVIIVELKNQMRFTFQYGQIRNYLRRAYWFIYNEIYIPVWIDQKPVNL